MRAALGQLVAAVLLPLTLAGGAFVADQWDDERRSAMKRLEGEAQALQVAVDREVALDLAVLHTLASSPAVDASDWAALHAAASRASAIRPASVITVFAADGRNLLNSSVPYGQPLPNVLRRPPERSVEWNGRTLPLPDRSLFTDPFDTGRPSFSGLMWGRVSRRPVVAVHLPVLRDGLPVLVIGLSYGADAYGRLLAAPGEAPGMVRALVDGSGLVIGRHPGHQAFVGRRAPVPFDAGGAPLPPRGNGRGTTLDGVDVYFAHSRSTVNDWTVIVAMPREQVLGPAWRRLWASLGVLVAAAALGAVLAARLTRRLAAPLRALADEARAPEAVPAGRVARSGVRELDTLARALRDAADLQQQRERLEREREEAREGLHRANEELTRANRHKDEFIGMLSHELRNPLAPIRNALYILGKADPTGPMALRARQIIERQVAHMTALVDDLLDITRMARGALELRPEDIDLAELVARIASDQRDLLAARELAFEVTRPEGPLWVHGDPTRLAQVLGNLLHNAAKFTPAGGRVTLRALADGDEAVVEVADTGAGIEPAQLDAIFEPFVQGAQSLARTAGGLGLGLAIVRRVVDAHGGRVAVFSGGPGLGSRFVVHLPLAVPSGEAPVTPEERRQAPRSAEGRRDVLLVEDNPDVAHALADMVRLLGHTVRWAPDAPAALALHRERAPDTVICDIGLPGTDGYGLARLLREAGTPARLIALSGYATPDDIARAHEAGFDAHIAKPADPARIVALLGRVAPNG